VGGFFPSVVIDQSRIYLTSRRPEILALDPVRERIDWRYDNLEPGGTVTAGSEGLVLAANRNGLQAVDATTGEQQWWVEQLSFSEDGSILTEDGTAYVDHWDGISAIDVETGEADWSVPGEYLGAVADSRVFANAGGEVQAINASTGDRLWRNNDVGGFDAMAVDTGTVYGTRAGDTHFGNEPSHVFALDAIDGNRQWAVSSTKLSFSQSPAVAPDVVAIGSLGGDVSVLNREDGSQRWCRRFGRWEMVPPAIGSEVVYITTGDVVQARRLNDGEPLWTKRVDADEQLGQADDEPSFYHHHALIGGVLTVVGYGRQGIVVDAFLEVPSAAMQ
jgi:outer membrane protein assembly factor BamB